MANMRSAGILNNSSRSGATGLLNNGNGRFLPVGKRSVRTIGIIGAGRFGTGAARELIHNGHQVLLIDKEEELLEPFAAYCHTAIGNAEDIEFLTEAGIKDVDAVIVAIGDNETASNHATINCKDLGLYVVAKATHATHGKILDRLGADYVVYPERDSGTRVARLLTRSSILEVIELYENVCMMEVHAGGELAGKTLDELNLPSRFGVQVLLILRGSKAVFPVSATDRVLEGDSIVVLGAYNCLQSVAQVADGD